MESSTMLCNIISVVSGWEDGLVICLANMEKYFLMQVAMHSCNHSIGNSESGRSLGLTGQPFWPAQGILGKNDPPYLRTEKKKKGGKQCFLRNQSEDHLMPPHTTAHMRMYTPPQTSMHPNTQIPKVLCIIQEKEIASHHLKSHNYVLLL